MELRKKEESQGKLIGENVEVTFNHSYVRGCFKDFTVNVPKVFEYDEFYSLDFGDYSHSVPKKVIKSIP